MGNPRLKPERLGEKLRQIRLALGVSQPEMLNRLGVGELIVYNQISGYETDAREPPLPILLQYARVANIYIETLVDDELDLPARIPSPTKSEGIKRKTTSRSKKR